MKKNLLVLISFFTVFSRIVSAQDVLYIDASGVNPNLTILSGEQVYVQGGVVANSGATGMDIKGELHLNDGGTSTSSNWTDNTATGAILNTSTGSVFLESAFLQNVTGAATTFYKLVFNNSSTNANGIRLLSNIVVSNQADFRDGLVYANSNALLITNNAATAITFAAPNNSSYTQSWVAAISPNGKLDREITSSASVYAFPVGSTTQSQLLEVTPASISGISRFSASWENPVTGVSPISISECGTIYMQVSNGGEWHLRPANSGSYGTGSFAAGQMTLKAHGLSAFPGLIDNQFALLIRTNGNTAAAGWTVPPPSCTSLPAFNAAGRTVASDYAARNSLTSWSDNSSQLGIGMTSVPLPIELLSFTGWNEGNVNELIWVTASEINSDHFEVEKSLSGKDFDYLGQEKASGTSFSSLTYHFTDFHPSHGFNYYRLKMVDRDETFQYSNVVAIEISGENNSGISLFPNPAKSDVTLQVQAGTDNELLIWLTDALGRILYSSPLTVSAGSTSYIISTADLPVAVYFIHVMNERANTSQTFKLVKAD